jgi:hypothetical protein
LRYIEDVSIPDGSQVTSGESLDKRWNVENNGTCNWDKGYNLKLIAGPELGAPSEQALYPARSGSQATIRILFTAPTEPGVYRSAWQAYNPDGRPFGDPVFIEIQVGDRTYWINKAGTVQKGVGRFAKPPPAGVGLPIRPTGKGYY